VSSIHNFSVQQKKQYTYFQIYVFFFYFCLALFMPFQPLYFIHIGIPIYGVLLNSALATLFSFFIGNLWSKHAVPGNRKKYLLIGNIGLITACILTIFTKSFEMMLVITLIQGIVPNSDVMATVMVYDLSASAENLTLTNEGERKYHQINSYARYRKFGSLGWAISLPLMGIILNFVPNGIISGITFISSAIGFFLISLFFLLKVDEPQVKGEISENQKEIQLEEDKLQQISTIKALRNLLTNKIYLTFIIFAFFYSSARSIAFQIQGIFFEGFTDNYFLWSLIYTIAALVEFPVMNIVAKYVKQWSWERMIIIAYFTTTLSMCLMLILASLFRSLLLGYFLQILTGITFGIQFPTSTYAIYTICKNQNKTLGQSFNNTIRMIGSLFANIVGAIFAYIFSENIMYVAIYGFAAICAGVAGFGYSFSVKRYKRRKTES
jgi:MFS family permease